MQARRRSCLAALVGFVLVLVAGCRDSDDADARPRPSQVGQPYQGRGSDCPDPVRSLPRRALITMVELCEHASEHVPGQGQWRVVKYWRVTSPLAPVVAALLAVPPSVPDGETLFCEGTTRWSTLRVAVAELGQVAVRIPLGACGQLPPELSEAIHDASFVLGSTLRQQRIATELSTVSHCPDVAPNRLVPNFTGSAVGLVLRQTLAGFAQHIRVRASAPACSYRAQNRHGTLTAGALLTGGQAARAAAALSSAAAVADVPTACQPARGQFVMVVGNRADQIAFVSEDTRCGLVVYQGNRYVLRPDQLRVLVTLAHPSTG